MRLIVGFVVVFLAALLLVGQLTTEAVAIALILTLATLAWRRLLRAASRRSIAPPDGGQAAAWTHAIAGLPVDTWRIGVALLRGTASRSSSWRSIDSPFYFGGRDNPQDAGRRAVAVIAGSLTPDRIVVDIGPGSATAATHRLAGAPDPDPDWLT